jgi:hypothetical protein
MSLNTLRMTAFLDLVHRSEFRMLGNKTFRKLNLFPFSGEGRKTITQVHYKELYLISQGLSSD